MKRKLKRLQSPRKGIQYIIYPETRKELSPFVFFDAGTMQRSDDGLFIGMHPHSGIGIITYFEGADLVHDDSGDNDQIIQDGGVQWIRAGGGVWHQEKYARKNGVEGSWPLTLHQLWMQLPPDLEESEIEYQNIQPSALPVRNNVKVVVGDYDGAVSPLKVPYDMTYLDVHLKAGENFSLTTKEKQTSGFIFPRKGTIKLWGDPIPLNHIGILESNEGVLQIEADQDAAFVLLTAEAQDYPIITKGGSIHTNAAALERSMHKIQQIAV